MKWVSINIKALRWVQGRARPMRVFVCVEGAGEITYILYICIYCKYIQSIKYKPLMWEVFVFIIQLTHLLTILLVLYWILIFQSCGELTGIDFLDLVFRSLSGLLIHLLKKLDFFLKKTDFMALFINSIVIYSYYWSLEYH